MSKFVLIHGMSAVLDDSFGKKVKERIRSHDFETIEPKFTFDGDITLENWMAEINKYKIDDGDNYLCHSLGCTFLIKFLFAKKLKANTVINIAGGYFDETQVWPAFPKIKAFVPTQDELDYYKKNVNSSYLIHSDNDHIYSQPYFDSFVEYTGANEIILPNRGHFGRSSGVDDIPEIEAILEKTER
ncbi:MAG: alpha/beta hydrolase [Clostridia bacterium]|nr:alpha/beta hydrolase [Clostridia bacterium]